MWPKTPKMEKSKKSISGHLKFFKRVQACSARVGYTEDVNTKTRGIDEFYIKNQKNGPVVKVKMTEVVLIWLCGQAGWKRKTFHQPNEKLFSFQGTKTESVSAFIPLCGSVRKRTLEMEFTEI